jgi:hypothetical protein
MKFYRNKKTGVVYICDGEIIDNSKIFKIKRIGQPEGTLVNFHMLQRYFELVSEQEANTYKVLYGN